MLSTVQRAECGKGNACYDSVFLCQFRFFTFLLFALRADLKFGERTDENSNKTKKEDRPPTRFVRCRKRLEVPLDFAICAAGGTDSIQCRLDLLERISPASDDLQELYCDAAGPSGGHICTAEVSGCGGTFSPQSRLACFG